MRRPLAIALSIAVVAGAWFLSRPEVVVVKVGDDVRAALRDAPAGAIVELEAGTHRGPLTLDEPLTLQGQPGATVTAASDEASVVTVTADNVSIQDLGIAGAASGVVVREAENVRLHSLDIEGADLHGIEIVDASGHVSAVRVTELSHALAQGIEIRNSDGRPDSVIENSTIVGGMEGIVSHVAELVIRNNVVSDTTMRGITVTEMSDAVVSGNRVRGVTGAGMYCGDMSRCQFEGNTVTGVAGDERGRSTAGWGLVVTYHAAASSHDDVLEGAAGERMASIGGSFRTRSPLEPGTGWAALAPASIATGAALAAVALLYLAAGAFNRRTSSLFRSRGRRRGPNWLLPLGVLGLGVQTFHMLEHGLQLFRVRVDGIPSRGGIVGPRVEAEWIHFGYNLAVLVGFVLVVIARRKGWKPPGRAEIGDRFLLAGVALQGYHSIEHSVKLSQHLSSGAKVNPGILGGEIDLVLLHFSINLGVYMVALGATVAYLWRDRPRELVTRRALSPG